jgi:hypothetical protein
LIPASDAVLNERRARMGRIGRVVKAYGRLVSAGSDGSDHLAITDILAELRHYCGSRGLAFDELDGAAYEQYLEDVAEMSAGFGAGGDRERGA